MAVTQTKDKHNLGYLFEERVFREFESLNCFDDIVLESQLKKEWGWDAAGIDQLLILGDYVIAVQLKYRSTRRRETICINNFIKSLDYTLPKCGKKLLFGLWVSRLIPFDDNIEHLKHKGVYCVSCFDSMESLIYKAKQTIIQKIQESITKCMQA
jgi:hypothetical protein